MPTLLAWIKPPLSGVMLQIAICHAELPHNGEGGRMGAEIEIQQGTRKHTSMTGTHRRDVMVYQCHTLH